MMILPYELIVEISHLVIKTQSWKTCLAFAHSGVVTRTASIEQIKKIIGDQRAIMKYYPRATLLKCWIGRRVNKCIACRRKSSTRFPDRPFNMCWQCVDRHMITKTIALGMFSVSREELNKLPYKIDINPFGRIHYKYFIGDIEAIAKLKVKRRRINTPEVKMMRENELNTEIRKKTRVENFERYLVGNMGYMKYINTGVPKVEKRKQALVIRLVNVIESGYQNELAHTQT